MVKAPIFRFYLYATIAFFACLNLAVASPPPSGTNGWHFCGVTEGQPDNRRYARSLANLNAGEPRTVRMIYFLPRDWQYRADVVQKMKDEIRTVQTFYAEAMQAEGYGEITFRVESDPQGEPMVHRVDGQHPFSHYDNTLGYAVFEELEQAFDFNRNIYFILLGTDALRQGDGRGAEGVAGRTSKNAGWALVANEFTWGLVAHELGHTFGLGHDFNDPSNIMSYTVSSWNRLSACSAEFLAVHPYFNPDTPIEEGEPPAIELVSPRAYPAGSQSVSVQLKVNDSEGLHQVSLFAQGGLVACRGLAGENDSVVEFDYDGAIGSYGFTSLSEDARHPVYGVVVDIHGNVNGAHFTLEEISPPPLDTAEAHAEIYFPDPNLRAAIETTLGKPPGTPVLRSDMMTLKHLILEGLSLSDVTGLEAATNLRHLSLAGNPVTDLTPLTNLVNLTWLRLEDMPQVPDLSGLSSLTNLRELHLSGSSISDISPVAGLTNLTSLNLSGNFLISDISAVAGLTNLTSLYFSVNSVSDISPVAALTNLRELKLYHNRVSDISPVAGLTRLTNLDIGNNSVSDLSPLVANAGLGSRDKVEVKGNPLSYQSLRTYIPVLQSRGVTVEFDNPTPTLLGDETLVEIPDPALREAVLSQLDIGGDQITDADMSRLTVLSASDSGISNLAGLEWATNLSILYLMRNSIENIDPLSDLTSLTELYLITNSVSDLTPLSGLINLTRLRLDENAIQDITPLSGLINLTTLGLPYNAITDLAPLVAYKGLKGDKYVDVRGNPLSPASINTHIPTLIDAGIDVVYDVRAEPVYVTVGDTFTISVTVDVVIDLAGWHLYGFHFRPEIFTVVSVQEGDLLKQGGAETFFQVPDGSIDNSQGVIREATAVRIGGSVHGSGELLSITLEAKKAASDGLIGYGIELFHSDGAAIHIETSTDPPGNVIVIDGIPGDVNGDRVVDIRDLILVAQSFGGHDPQADVNGDGIVNILDLVLVAGLMNQ